MLNKQKGQAMALTLILMSFSLMVVVFSFNASQLNLHSTKLQNTADNTAYSVATIAARDFNFKAYTNRAAVANQIAVAQMVGLSSWFNMTDKFAENACDTLCWVPYLGQVLSGIKSAVGAINQVAQPVFETLVYAENAILVALAGSQQIVHYGGMASAVLTAESIVTANDAKAKLDLMQNAQLLNSVRHVWINFQQRHSRNNNQSRNKQNISANGANQYQDFSTVILESRDKFTQERTYKLSAPWSLTAFPLRWKTHKTGGSELISNGSNQGESWTSMDTISFHLSKFRCSWSGCRWRGYSEIPLGWASTSSDNRADIDNVGEGSSWGSSRDINGTAANYAGSEQDTRGGYSGVQAFYGLSTRAHKQSHTDNIAIVVSKPQKNLRTSSEITVSGDRTNPAINESMSGDRMTALSTAQAYYSRPKDLMTLTSSWARDDGRHEYGNLYNPYWQTRLSDSTNTERSAVLLITRNL
jgi:hypothetical protein